MKKLVMAVLAALTILFSVPAAHAQGWTLLGNPMFTYAPVSPSGGSNPVSNGGTYTISPTSLSLISKAKGTPSGSFMSYSASCYGKFTQNFAWQGMGPPTFQFTVHTTYSVQGSVSFQFYDRASSYASPSGGGVSGDTSTSGSPNPYTSSSVNSFVVSAAAPGSFSASTSVNFGVATLAYCPPSGPSHQADASATGALSL